MIIRKFEPYDFEGVLNIEMEAFTEHNPFVYMNFYEMNDEGFFVATAVFPKSYNNSTSSRSNV